MALRHSWHERVYTRTYLVEDDFWSQIVGGAADGKRALVGSEALGKPKVGDADVPLCIQQQIFWLSTRCQRGVFLGNASLYLEVPVHHVEAVQVLERQDDFRGVKSRGIFREPALSFEVGEKLATSDEIHDEVEVGGVLKAAAQVDDKGVGYLLQHAAFSTCMGDLHVEAVV